MLKGDIDLLNHVIGKRMLRVVVLLVLFFDDIVFFHIHCSVLYCPKMFLLKFDADQLMH